MAVNRILLHRGAAIFFGEGSTRQTSVIPTRRLQIFRGFRLYTSVAGPVAQKTSQTTEPPPSSSASTSSSSTSSTSSSSSAKSSEASPDSSQSSSDSSLTFVPPAWEEDDYQNLESFAQLPNKDFGANQLIETNEDFKRSLRAILRELPPISHAFAYGSGVFPQSDATKAGHSPHPNAPEAIRKWQKGGGKMIDFILGTKFSQHFHSLNLRRHADHYSMLGRFGSAAVSWVQDSTGAGVYFNPYVVINGTLIKYGVVNMETLHKDLSEWNTLYLAGRLHKPVKILTEDPNIRLANQRNLMAAVRCALLLLPPSFTEIQLYEAIASISYTGDPRMSIGGDSPNKVSNIVNYQLRAFRQLYSSLVSELPNIRYADPRVKGTGEGIHWENLPLEYDLQMSQHMDLVFRANMVRRLPKAFRERVYFLYQKKFQIPGRDFQKMLDDSKDEDAKGGVRKPVGGPFDRRIAGEDDLRDKVKTAVRQTVKWPSLTQSIKGPLTAGWSKSVRYAREKREKAREKAQEKPDEKVAKS